MTKKGIALLLILVFVVGAVLTGCSNSDQGTGDMSDVTLRVSTQNWTEASILGWVTQIMIEENTDYNVERVELESSVIQWSAINNNQIDIYPSYTSGFFNLFEDDDTVLYDPDAVYDYVSTKLEDDYDIVMLERMGFYNNYDLAVLPEVAQQYNLETYSDLAAVSDQLSIAADANFEERADCYPLLRENYGMNFKDVYQMSVNAKYVALENKEAEVVHCYTTDAAIKRLGLVLLTDDKHAGMIFDSTIVMRGEIYRDYPEVAQALNEIKITTAEMQEMNGKVEDEGMAPEDVAREFLEDKGLI